jgi:isocitrate dehydrogenase (NAD+)
LSCPRFLKVGREIAQSYPDIAFTDLIVDNTAMQLVRDPTRFDVIVTGGRRAGRPRIARHGVTFS